MVEIFPRGDTLYSEGLRLTAAFLPKGSLIEPDLRPQAIARMAPKLTFIADSLFVQADNPIDNFVNCQIVCLNFHSIGCFEQRCNLAGAVLFVPQGDVLFQLCQGNISPIGLFKL